MISHPLHPIFRCIIALSAIALSLSSCTSFSPPPPTPTATALPTAAPTATVMPTNTPATAPSATARPDPTPTVPFTVTVDSYLNSLVADQSFSGSVLIARRGQVLLTKGYGLAKEAGKVPNTSQTRFIIGSVTKSFTAVSILMLQSQGKLDIYDPICRYLDHCPAAWQPITIRHLLTHTSGIPEYATPPLGDMSRATESLSHDQVVAIFRNQPLDFKPGARYAYSNSGYYLLGLIVEQAAGHSFEQFLQENIFGPLRMKDSGLASGDRPVANLATGYLSPGVSAPPWNFSLAYSAGGIYSTVEDLYKWDQALDTDRLLPANIGAEMFRSQVAIPSGSQSGVWSAISAYGYGWMLGEYAGHRFVGHPGGVPGYTSVLARFPDDQVTLVVLSNSGRTSVENMVGGLGLLLFTQF